VPPRRYEEAKEKRIGCWCLQGCWKKFGPGLWGIRTPILPPSPPDPAERKIEWFRYLHILIKWDWEEYISTTWKALVYLARYGGQSIELTQDWPITKVYRLTGMMASIIKAENGPSSD
jgi:hypothetical protein